LSKDYSKISLYSDLNLAFWSLEI